MSCSSPSLPGHPGGSPDGIHVQRKRQRNTAAVNDERKYEDDVKHKTDAEKKGPDLPSLLPQPTPHGQRCSQTRPRLTSRRSETPHQFPKQAGSPTTLPHNRAWAPFHLPPPSPSPDWAPSARPNAPHILSSRSAARPAGWPLASCAPRRWPSLHSWGRLLSRPPLPELARALGSPPPQRGRWKRPSGEGHPLPELLTAQRGAAVRPREEGRIAT